MGEVVGRQKAVAIIVRKAVLLPGQAGAVHVGAPLHGGDVAVVLWTGYSSCNIIQTILSIKFHCTNLELSKICDKN